LPGNAGQQIILGLLNSTTKVCETTTPCGKQP